MIKFVIMLADIKKAVLSGIMISVGGAVYLSCIAKGYTWLGAILFAAGLYTICEYGFNLYTGKVGYIAFRFTDFSYIYGSFFLCLYATFLRHSFWEFFYGMSFRL